MEDEGTFGENAQRYWKNASKAWEEYGQKLIPEPGSEELRLASLEKHQEMAKQLSKELDDIQPGLREKIRQNKYDALSEEQRNAYEKPAEKRNEKENALAYQAEAQLEVAYNEIVKQVPKEQKSKAEKLAAEALRHENIAIDISRSRDTVNYAYWELRAKVEQERETTVKARELIYKGTQLYRREANLIGAKDKFQDGFLLWRKILDKYPALVEDGLTGDDLMDMIKVYREILHRMDEEFPKPFTLQDIIDKYDRPR
jgi:hypothetical protein